MAAAFALDAPCDEAREIAELLRFLKEQNVRNVVWVTGDVHYCAAHHYDAARAQFQEFLRDNPTVEHFYDERYSPESNTPQTSVTW